MEVDVTIPADRNFTEKEGEHKLKNKTFCNETLKMLNTIPVQFIQYRPSLVGDSNWFLKNCSLGGSL
jgi:hypothetical protein